MNTKQLVATLIVVLGIVAISIVILESHTRGAERDERVKLACIEKSEGNAEAVLCQRATRGSW